MIHLIDRFTDHLRKGRYNQATIKAYRDAVFMFYNNNREMPQNQINEEVISDYLHNLKEKKSYQNEVIIQNGKAIKLFYKVIFDKVLDIKANGSKQQQPPYILSKSEIRLILTSIPHKKHLLISSMAYGLGLKLNEIVNIRIDDIDFKNKYITIKSSSKDTEDRILIIPEFIEKQLKLYLSKKEIVSNYLFENKKGKKISPRGVQLYFSRIIEELGLDKSITIQNLRHSFAVHHLDNGIDIHHVQKILGHKFLQTTVIYNNLTKFELKNLRSPLEDLV